MRLVLLGLGCLFGAGTACGSSSGDGARGSAGAETTGGAGSAMQGGEAGNAGTTQASGARNGGQGAAIGNGGSAGSPDPGGCVRVVAVLPPNDDARSWRSLGNLPGGVWRTSAGLHFAFTGLYETAHPMGLPNTFIHEMLVVETFDPETASYFRSNRLWWTSVFVGLGVWRFMVLVRSRPKAESPTQEMLRDGPFVAIAFSWMVVVLWLVYNLEPG